MLIPAEDAAEQVARRMIYACAMASKTDVAAMADRVFGLIAHLPEGVFKSEYRDKILQVCTNILQAEMEIPEP